ncbi:MAG: saccharopine dehydrogenase NADP-binding domain-containing protein [Candidatus Lernaella stagnicola]|nr:saccharopine dehydrogenase NADP-binding domain-containing protein [Candidatus Lernaella stagnicola]
MKVLLLGGAGDMALEALRELNRDPEAVTQVTIDDLNVPKAKEAIRKLNLAYATDVVDHDLFDREWLVAEAAKYDVVLGFAGPFYKTEAHCAEACIAAGTPYVSIADDYDSYLEVVKLDEMAREKKVKILTGFGNSPGITQMLARKGYNSMEKCRRINVNWAAGSNENVGATNLMHLFHIFTGTTLQTFRGKEGPVNTGEGRKMVEFPYPMGWLPVYYTGHAESVSLPRNLPGLEEATVHGGVQPPYIPRLVKTMSNTGMFSTHERRRKAANFFHRIEGWFAGGGLDKSVGRIDVYGVEGGKAVYRYYTYIGHIALLTAVPTVQAAWWLYKGKFNKAPGGVYSAERILEKPDPFLSELIERGLEIYYYE